MRHRVLQNHAVMQQDFHVQLAQHLHMNKLHDHNTTQFEQCSASHYHSYLQSLHYMLSVVMQTLPSHNFTRYLGLCCYMFAIAAVVHHSREAS